MSFLRFSHSIKLLSKKHNRQNFDCGNEKLNKYLQQIAGQDMSRYYNKDPLNLYLTMEII